MYLTLYYIILHIFDWVSHLSLFLALGDINIRCYVSIHFYTNEELKQEQNLNRD